MANALNISIQSTLFQVLSLCSKGFWYSLNMLKIEHVINTNSSSSYNADLSLELALLIRSHARKRHQTLRGKIESEFGGATIPVDCRFLVEFAFQQLRLAEQYLLLFDQDNADNHCQLFIRALIAAAIQVHTDTISQEEEDAILRMAKSLAIRLSSQQQLQLAIESGSLPRRFVVVLGMHRSGTSALTGMLSQAGFDAPTDMVSPDSINPRGYWESAGMNKINDELLEAFSASWRTPTLPENWQDTNTAERWRCDLLKHLQHIFCAASIPVIKDPRLCILLPGLLPWLESGFAQWDILLPIRHPLEVARSLEDVQAVNMEMGIQLWLEYVLTAERYSRNYRRCFLSFDKLIENPRSILEKTLNLLQADNGSNNIRDEASSFVTTELYRKRRHDQMSFFNQCTESVATSRNLAIRLYEILTSSEIPNIENLRSLNSMINLCTI